MRYCPNCGKSLSDGDRFCPSCGKSLSNALNQDTRSSGMIPPFLQNSRIPSTSLSMPSSNRGSYINNDSYHIPQIEAKSSKGRNKVRIKPKLILYIVIIAIFLSGGLYLGDQGVRASKINLDNFMQIGATSCSTYDEVKSMLGSGKLIDDNKTSYDVYEWSSIFTKKKIIVRFNDGKVMGKEKIGLE